MQGSLTPSPVLQPYEGSLAAHLDSLWATHRSFIFCLATGAVVRLIAPLLQHKAIDPAVVVVDPSGQFVISLCSGHQGGADQLARFIASQLQATPILTGAANDLAMPGIDILGTPFGWQRGTGDWTGVSAAIARQEPIEVIQEVGSTLWQAHLPLGHGFTFGAPESLGGLPPKPGSGLAPPSGNLPPSQIFPRCNGIPGCCGWGLAVSEAQPES